MLYNKEVPGSEHPFYRMGFIVVAPIESQEDKITGIVAILNVVHI